MDKGFRRDTGSLPRNHAVDRRPTPVAQVLGVTAPEVAAAITRAERGLTAVAVPRRLASAVGPDGEIDLATLGRQVGETWQAAQEGRAA
jgi:hypothetical protein